MGGSRSKWCPVEIVMRFARGNNREEIAGFNRCNCARNVKNKLARKPILKLAVLLPQAESRCGPCFPAGGSAGWGRRLQHFDHGWKFTTNRPTGLRCGEAIDLRA